MSKKAAMVLITTSFPISGDGSEAAGSFVADLAEEISKYLPVRVVAPGKHTDRLAWTEGVEVFRFAAPDQPLSTLKPWSPTQLRTIRRVLAAGEAATRDAVAAGPTTHMLALWALPSGHWARRVARETTVPYSVWTLGSDIWTLGRVPFVRSYLRRILREAHTCYSDGLKLAEVTRCISGRTVEFLPSTRRIERSRTRPPKADPPYRFLFLGRWHRNKGVDLLLDSLELLGDEDWHRIEAIEICGGGPLEELVKKGVDKLRVAGRPVELRGFLDKPEAEDAILCADWLLIPSRLESIPVVFSDAIKLGCPVVAMPVGDLPALLNATPACGRLATGVSAADFSAALRSVLTQTPAEFASGVATAASRFGLPATASTICKLAKEAIV